MLEEKRIIEKMGKFDTKGKSGEIEGEISAERLDIDCRVGRGEMVNEEELKTEVGLRNE